MKNFLIYALIGLGVITYNVSTQADRDGAGAGAIVAQGNVDAFTIQLGDCFDNTSSLANEEIGEVSNLPGVPCSQPHDNEVFAIFNLDQPTFPGSEEISELSFDACLDRFESFVGLDYETSSLDIAALYPSKESWSQQGDREVVCAVYDMNLGKLTGSTRNSGI
jgi:hypothetical protein